MTAAPIQIALALSCLLCACGATESPLAEPEGPPVDTTPKPLPATQFFIPGELMSFEFHFRDVVVGRGGLAVGQPGVQNGRPTLIVRSELETVGVGKMVKDIRDDITSWIDTERGRSVRYRADIIFGKSSTLFDCRLAGRWVFIEILRRGPKYEGPRKRYARTKRQWRLPEGAVGHDSHSFLGALRAWEDGRIGERRYMYVLSGSRIWRTDLELVGAETRDTPMGLYPVLQFRGTTQRMTYKMEPDPRRKARSFTIWLSDDANRLPLLIEGSSEYGTAAIKLVGYHKL